MNKKKTRKSKAAKSMRDLPAKTLNAKTAKGVKGGNHSENVSLPYGKIEWTYTKQKTY
jgi:type VI protein secretion system component Hcp